MTFPPTWGAEALRGTVGRVLAACHELFDRTLPPLDDSLAPQLRPGAATLAAARAAFLADATAAAATAESGGRMEALMAALADVADVEVPESLIAENGRQMYSANLLDKQAKGQLSPAVMRQLMTDSLVDAYIKTNQATIEGAIKASLAVTEIARAEGIAPSAEALEQEVATAKLEFEAWKQSYDEEKLREQAAEVLAGTAVKEWLMARATVTFAK